MPHTRPVTVDLSEIQPGDLLVPNVMIGDWHPVHHVEFRDGNFHVAFKSLPGEIRYAGPEDRGRPVQARLATGLPSDSEGRSEAVAHLTDLDASLRARFSNVERDAMTADVNRVTLLRLIGHLDGLDAAAKLVASHLQALEPPKSDLDAEGPTDG